MKKTLFLLFALIFAFNANALRIDSISKLEVEIGTLKKENYALVSKVYALESKLTSINRDLIKAQQEIYAKVDSVKETAAINTSTIKQDADEFGVKLMNQNKELTSSISNISSSLSNKILWIIISITILLVVVVSYIVFARKKSNSTDDCIRLLKDAQKNIESQIVKLDNQLIKILEHKMKVESESRPTNAEPDHSLPLKVADEIVRIQNNIDRMDPTDKNVGRLNKALSRMKTSFTAYGYEIVDMRGQEYTDNIPFEVRFIPDYEIEEGKRIISGMDKLMVRYNGKMIQAPILAVRQNV